MPRNLSEADRKKNQFDKEERVHLLAIMKQYAPLLDKSASTLTRKKIWTTIEDEFKKAGFTRKTSAQLKKYWQNYKYHCKKATAFRKVFPYSFPLPPSSSPPSFFSFPRQLKVNYYFTPKIIRQSNLFVMIVYRVCYRVDQPDYFYLSLTFESCIITKSSISLFRLIGVFFFFNKLN